MKSKFDIYFKCNPTVATKLNELKESLEKVLSIIPGNGVREKIARSIKESFSITDIFSDEGTDLLNVIVESTELPLPFPGADPALRFLALLVTDRISGYSRHFSDEFDSVVRMNTEMKEKWRNEVFKMLIDPGTIDAMYSASQYDKNDLFSFLRRGYQGNQIIDPDAILAPRLILEGKVTDLKKYFSIDNEDYKKLIDKMISSSPDFDELYNLSDDIKNSESLPLVLFNSAIDRDKKIKIIKKSYVQKNIPRYIESLKRSLVDMNDLDDFIEATVLQNNRVSKKEEGVRDIFHRVLFGNGNSWRCSSIPDPKNMLNFASFMDKYSPYIDAKFLAVEFDRKNISTFNVRSVAKEFIKQKSLIERIRAAKENEDLFASAITDDSFFGKSLFQNPETTTDEEKSALLDYQINCRKNFDIMSILSMSNNYEGGRELFFNYLRNPVIFEGMRNSFNRYEITKDRQLDFLTGLIDFENEDLLNEISILPKKDLKCLFAYYDDTRGWSQAAQALGRVARGYISISYIDAVLKYSQKGLLKKFIIDKLVSFFKENDISELGIEVINFISINQVSNEIRNNRLFGIRNSDSFYSSVSFPMGSTPVTMREISERRSDREIAGLFTDAFINLFKNHAPEETEIISKFETVREQIELMLQF